jgi:hypothetical protein
VRENGGELVPQPAVAAPRLHDEGPAGLRPRLGLTDANLELQIGEPVVLEGGFERSLYLFRVP